MAIGNNDDYPDRPISLGALRSGSTNSEVRATEVPLPPRKWKSRVLAPLVLLAVFVSLLGWATWDVLFPGRDVRVIPVVSKLRAVDSDSPKAVPGATNPVPAVAGGQLAAQGSGWVEPDPYEQYVSALADGVISEILVLDGETIKPGQVVARMISDDARIAVSESKANLELAEAKLASAKVELDAAQRDWDNPIAQRQTLEVTRAALAEARAEHKQLPALIQSEGALCKQLRDECDRMATARKKDIATDFELKRAQYRLESQHAKHEATIQRKAILDAKIARLESDVKAAEQDLKLRIKERRALDEAKAGVQEAAANVSSAKAKLSNAELRFGRMEIRAPRAGVVMRRLKSPGEKLSVQSDNPDSAKVLSFYDPSHLQVRVDVALTEAGRVQVGQRAEIVVDVEGDTVYAGRVTRFVNEADIQKNTLEVKVAIDKPSVKIRPSMYARVKFFTAAPKSVASGASATAARPTGGAGMYALYIPKSLVRSEGGTSAVFVASDSRAQRVEITLGKNERDGWVEVTSGLHEGDRLIATDVDTLRDGESVTVIGEMGTKELN